MTEKQFRNKVTWFSFVFSLLVIWGHSYNAELFLGRTEEMALVYRAEHWLGDYVSQIAVPGFFMISGYLFYRNFTWEKLQEKWDRRIRSLLTPYILWNFLYYLGYVAGSRLPWVTDVVGKGEVPFTLSHMVDAVISYRYNYVFWYLYQLILLTALAPVLYQVLKRSWGQWIFLALVAWLVVRDVRLPFLNADALAYYGIAAALGLETQAWRECRVCSGRDHGGEERSGADCGGSGNGLPWYLPEAGWSLRGGLSGAGMIGLAALFYYLGLSSAQAAGFVACRLLAVFGLWLLVPGERLPEPKAFMCHNFFLYATHFAFVRFINKAAALVLPAGLWVPFVLFLVMPFLALALSTLLGACLRRAVPGMWDLLNGYRI